MKKKLFILCAVLLLQLKGFAQFGVVAPLHVDGNQLNDQYGNTVVLHGVMDTPNPYFNSYRWGSTCADSTVSACINYFDELFTAICNPAKGTYCNLFRLHLDPCWTNDPDKTSTGSETGEANISRFSSSRLSKYLNSLYWPIAKKAIAHGLYVVIRPPGVCPKELKVGDDYQSYLKTVWNIVSSNSNIKENSGIISLELANEPVHVYDSDGNSSSTALRDYFQPIIDVIRANGYTGIIWVPGAGYQSQYQDYASYPVSDGNYGYAVHVYPGWYGASDTCCDHDTFIANFKAQVPVVTSHPILVSEIDWSPEVEGSGKYNEFGEWVASNMGTWGTASTSKWGTAWKAVMDYFGNISMTLSGTGDYLDIDKYLADGTVTAAFDGNYEACAMACFYWYYEYSLKNYAHSSDDSSDSSLIPAFDTSSSNYVPSNWKIVDNGTVCSAGSASSGPRVMAFPSGSDFTKGLYIRTISSSKDGYAEYGSISGSELSLKYACYLVSFNAVAWTGSPYVKCEVIDPSGNVVVTKIMQCTKNINRNTSSAFTGSTNLSFSFYGMTKGNYRIRFTPVADANGNKGDWKEVVIGNISMTYQGNPLAFTSSNEVPKGWKIVDDGTQLSAGSASSGPRTFQFASGGDFDYGLYIRQKESSEPGYAEFGTTGGYGMTLLNGSYQLTYNVVAWQGTPYMKCEVLDANNNVLGSQIVKVTKNVNRDLSVSTSGSTQGSVSFSAPSTGYYHFRWTPVADANGSSGSWLEAVIGHIKISSTSSSAKSIVINDNTTTDIPTTITTVKKTGKWYSLDGRMTENPHHGLYIHNGKKILIK